MRGFTLIETVIYIALFGFLMTGMLIASADLLESAGRSNSHATVEDEGSFVSRKLEWALTGMTAAPTLDTTTNCQNKLTLAKTGNQLNLVVFQYNSGSKSIEMKEGATGPNALTTGNVSVSCLSFAAIAAQGSGPAGVSASFTINGETFSVTKYLRQ